MRFRSVEVRKEQIAGGMHGANQHSQSDAIENGNNTERKNL